MSQNSIVINNVPIVWNEDNAGFKFFGNEAIMFWKNPSLASILKPLRDEIGEELYALLIAFEASKGTYEDYHAIVALGENFEEGFLKWGRAVSAAGWGCFSILAIDWEMKEAEIAVDAPWELTIFSSEHTQDSAPFLSGKISGIFSYAFGTNCRSEVLQIIPSTAETPGRVIFRVHPSAATLQEELLNLQSRRNLSENHQIRLANSSLRKSQQRLLDIMQSAGEFIWEMDAGLRLTFATSQLTEVLRCDLQKILRRPLSEFLHSSDRLTFERSIRAASEKRSLIVKLEARFLRSDGEEIWVQMKLKPLLDHSAQVIGYLGLGLDINERRRTEVLLEKEREKAVYASKMATLGEMSGGIAHEINNPLAIIIGTAQQMRERLETAVHEQSDFDHDSFLKWISRIEQTGERISKIVKGLRSFARDAEGDPFEPTSVRGLIEDTLSFCQTRLEHQGVRVVIPRVSEDLMIVCRSVQISQVLLNLINNASDAIHGQSSPWIGLEVEEGSQTISVAVCDSGPGVPARIRDKIMQPFFTTKEIGKGTGLGLSISQGLIEAHGGKFYLDDTSPHTRFVIEIPKAIGRQETKSGSAGSAA